VVEEDTHGNAKETACLASRSPSNRLPYRHHSLLCSKDRWHSV